MCGMRTKRSPLRGEEQEIGRVMHRILQVGFANACLDLGDTAGIDINQSHRIVINQSNYSKKARECMQLPWENVL